MSGQLEDLPVETNQNEPLFTTVNMLDPQLCVKSSLNFAVSKSAQNITYHSQGASSATNSGINFSVIVPSLSTVISRKVMLRTQISFSLTGTAAAGQRLINWGVDTSLAPFAIPQLIQNMNANSPFADSFSSAAGHRGRGSYPVTITGNDVNGTGAVLQKQLL